jgi:hypothetical protein
MLEKIPIEVNKEMIFNRYPWANPINLELSDSEKEFFCDPVPWSFNKPQLKMIYVMLGVVEDWYISRGLLVEVRIFDFKEVQGHIFVEMICGNHEVEQIFDEFSTANFGY